MNVSLLRGKWMFINDEKWGREAHRFVVDYLSEEGEVKRAYCKSAFSSDIKEAILRGGSQ